MRRPRSELFGMAFETLRRNPGRSVLTLLGLAIGVGAFIAMVSFGEGARRAVMDQFKALGTHLVRVRGTSRGGQERRPLSDADIAAIQRDSTSISKIIPVARVTFETRSSFSTFAVVTRGTFLSRPRIAAVRPTTAMTPMTAPPMILVFFDIAQPSAKPGCWRCSAVIPSTNEGLESSYRGQPAGGSRFAAAH